MKSAAAQAAPGAVGTTATVSVCHWRNWARTADAGNAGGAAAPPSHWASASSSGEGWPLKVLVPSAPGITANPPGMRKSICAMACQSMEESFVELATG